MKSPNFKTREEVVSSFVDYKGVATLSPAAIEEFQAKGEVTKVRINKKTYYLVRRKKSESIFDIYVWNPPF